jgi:hypothetical protein
LSRKAAPRARTQEEDVYVARERLLLDVLAEKRKRQIKTQEPAPSSGANTATPSR